VCANGIDVEQRSRVCTVAEHADREWKAALPLINQRRLPAAENSPEDCVTTRHAAARRVRNLVDHAAYKPVSDVASGWSPVGGRIKTVLGYFGFGVRRPERRRVGEALRIGIAGHVAQA